MALDGVTKAFYSWSNHRVDSVIESLLGSKMMHLFI